MTQEHSSFNSGASLSPPPQSLLARILAILLSAAFMVVAFMFSLVALAIVAVAAIGLGGWFWWKTRALRKAMRAGIPPEAMQRRESGVIEGEFVRETNNNPDDPRLLR